MRPQEVAISFREHNVLDCREKYSLFVGGFTQWVNEHVIAVSEWSVDLDVSACNYKSKLIAIVYLCEATFPNSAHSLLLAIAMPSFSIPSAFLQHSFG